MDRDDWLYMLGLLLISAGAWLFHPGAGLVCAGIGVISPFFRSKKGPPK